jgi:hypothetical protein
MHEANDRELFAGSDIMAALELDPNETFVPIGRLCERLGLKRSTEERRVRRHNILGQSTRRLRVENDEGEMETALCLRVEQVPLWLSGLEAAAVTAELRPQLERFQRECSSLLWQSFRPQGYPTTDTLLPPRHEQDQAEQAYVASAAMATLARHQLLLERQLSAARAEQHEQGSDPFAPPISTDTSATLLAQTVRRVAQSAAERSRRNEYLGVYSGLYRQFGISSYRRMPPGRLNEALEWLERWHGDLLGEPEPPPDI